MFSKSKLKDKFALVTWNRGLHLFRSHNVLSVAKDGDLIRGPVRSATNAQVTYLSVIEVIDDEIFTRCTCPVARYCKHAVAVGNEFLESQDTAADDKEVEQWLTSLKKAENGVAARKKVIVYLLEYKKSK